MKIPSSGLLITIAIVIASISSSSAQSKFQKWQKPSFFRGFNVGYYCMVGECERTQSDMDKMKAFGANLAQINVYAQGFREIEYPYDVNETGIDRISEMVEFCRNASLYYIIAVRSGPGRYDVSDDIESPLWYPNASYAVQMYGKMLKEIAQYYSNDTLFAGLNLTVEPDPFANEGYEPDELEAVLLSNGIDLYQIYETWIDSVRSFDTELPLIVQGPNWSNPEYWGEDIFIKKHNDPYIIYDFHSYEPYLNYTHAYPMYSASYQETDWCVTTDNWETWDSLLYADVIFSHVKDFQQTHDVPILMGEFGMWWPQVNGEKYLNDLYEIAIGNQWHFALWSWRADTALAYPSYNYELFDELSSGTFYHETVQAMFEGSWHGINAPTNKDNKAMVFPNPCDGEFIIKTKLIGSYKVDIINMLGETVYSTEFNTTDNKHQKLIHFNGQQGIYILHLSTDEISYSSLLVVR